MRTAKKERQSRRYMVFDSFQRLSRLDSKNPLEIMAPHIDRQKSSHSEKRPMLKNSLSVFQEYGNSVQSKQAFDRLC
jgi:hypothetical protein